MNQEQLQQLRLALECELQAEAQIISFSPSLPAIFLLGENHARPDAIDQNIAIGKLLVRNAGVSLVAVEGAIGGRKFNMQSRTYLPDRHPATVTAQDVRNPCSPRFIADRRRFAIAIVGEPGVQVVGVDSPELCNQMIEDVEAGRIDGRQIGAHPNQGARSRHMILALVDELRERPNVRGAILNAGERHKNDIISAQTGNSEAKVDNIASLVYVRSQPVPGQPV
jgi:hypothetical protein